MCSPFRRGVDAHTYERRVGSGDGDGEVTVTVFALKISDTRWVWAWLLLLLPKLESYEHRRDLDRRRGEASKKGRILRYKQELHTR